MSDTFRFVVTFRCERGRDVDAASAWRGWIELIYPVGSEKQEVDRRYFIHLDEASNVLAEMIRDAGGPDAGQF